MNGLVLSGTQEARILCAELAKNHVKATASLAGVTRTPAKLDLPTRTGGFGGPEGFAQYLKANSVKWVIDATHPFASKMTKTAAQECKAANIPYVILQRPEWQAVNGDIWHHVDAISELVSLIPAGSNVFLGTGRQTLAEFSILEERNLLCRVVDVPTDAFPFENGRYLQGRPPFSIQEEGDLFKKEKIDWIVVKNSGGSGGFSKLLAARSMGIPVALINRTSLPDAQCVSTVEDALKWLKEIQK